MSRATMMTNAIPAYKPTDNPTNCCPRFKPESWEGQELHLSTTCPKCAKYYGKNYVVGVAKVR